MPATETLLLALVSRLRDNGTLTSAAVADMATAIEADDPACADLAHQLRCLLVRADSPSQSEWDAQRARRRFRIVDPD